MKFVIGADEDRPILAFLAAHLREKNHDVRVLPIAPWARIATDVASTVSRGDADQGIVCCWTGTGVTIAANKIAGIRAALCTDAQTATGARKWNDANILAMSLRTLSEPVASEIVDAWLATKYDGTEDASLAIIKLSEA